MKGNIRPAGTKAFAKRSSTAPEAPNAAEAWEMVFLCFTVLDQELGIYLNLVSEIVKPPPITRVPRTAEHILGIVSIRGQVVTLLDSRRILNLETAPWPKTSRVVVVSMGEEQIGLLVDSVTQVRRFEASAIEKKPMLVGGQSEDYVSYAARSEERARPLFVLDLQMILRERMK